MVWLAVPTFTCAAKPPVTELVFSPEGDAVIVLSQSGMQRRTWPALEHVWNRPTSMANPRAAKFSPRGDAFAVVGGNPAEHGVVEVYSWPDAKRIHHMVGGEDSIQSVVWIDQSQLATAGADRVVSIWKLDGSKKPTATFRGHSRPVDAICHLPTAEILITAGVDQSLRVWDLKQNALLRNMNQHTGGVHQLAARPSQGGLPMVASAAADRTVRFWQPTIGRMVRYARLDAVPLDISWLPDGKLLAAACDDGQLRFIAPDSVTVSKPLPVIPDGWAYAVATHPTDGDLAVGGAGGVVTRVQRPRAPADD